MRPERIMIKYLLSLIFTLTCIIHTQAQEKPRLVVGIVVDQMRMDYIYRFQHRFGNDGFRRLIREGYTLDNAHYNYVPTSTGPGHTSVYTGTTPANHGVIGNSWYDKFIDKNVYCAGDENYNTVGADDDNGQMSPHRMLTTTFTDQLRLALPESKVIGISIKDRGAIFPAGHLGLAYWYDPSSGDFITSDYYHSELPKWVERFNKRRFPVKYMRQTWKTLEPINTYEASGPDESPYEQGLLGKTTFPYDLSKSDDKSFGLLNSTPFGNDLLTELAITAIEEEKLGQDDERTDVLAVSFSSTDYIGHNFGPRSVEVEDTYLRLDQNIAQLLRTLDDEVGPGNYTVFLTADHGVADVPKYLMDQSVPAGYLQGNLEVNEYLTAQLGEGNWVRNVSFGQIFLNHELFEEKNISISETCNKLVTYLLKKDGIGYAWTADNLMRSSFDEQGIKGLFVRGYNLERSGDVAFSLEPGWLWSSNERGTSHGSAFNYDTHVPVIFFGKNVRQGRTAIYHTITDIAPTISAILSITLPNGATGEVLEEVIQR
ncbi:alkaline phosphatase PafA [Fulvivirga sedimenti]|uniref:Alkaline phosphatase family protein n=1 Tax=Fulvivirga sedimenti TaxID=2879465 RepID=A0A9X1KUX5_9BACT|nr:alkaline phosphatase PafA [Fulvivirga sedimenti]MCA6074043.1 alkaline phosphatase family protein [Fulvivirga sedimenti]